MKPIQEKRQLHQLWSPLVGILNVRKDAFEEYPYVLGKTLLLKCEESLQCAFEEHP